jgi:hypothetical protein
MLPTELWRGSGADVRQLEAILSAKLKMDDRKPLTLSFGKQQKKNSRFTSVLTMFVSFLFGFLYTLPLLASFKDTIFALWMYFTLFLFFLVFTLITDFSNILIDTKDKLIIFPKPVNDKTIFLSKTLHIFIYLFRIVLPMALPGWIVFSMIKGWKAAVWFPIPILLLLFISLFLVNGMYLLLIRVSKSKFKEVINYFQIVVSILFFAGFYLLPQLFDTSGLENLDIINLPYIQYTPSFWLAGCWTWMEPETTVLAANWWSIAAILLPIVSIWVTVKWLAPGFMKRIAAIDGVEDTAPVPSASTNVKSKSKLYLTLANLMNKNGASKAGFIIAWLQTARSRSFKMKVYPFFAYVPVYFAFLILSNRETSVSDTWATLQESNKFLLLLYISGFVLMQAINYTSISDQYKAAWIYHAAPIEKPGYVMAGAYKAMWAKYYLPYITVISAFVLWVWGPMAIFDVLLALVNMTLFGAVIMRMQYRNFPFSLIEQMVNSGKGAAMRGFLTMGVIGILGFGHYMAMPFLWLKLLFTALSGIFLWLVWDSYKNTSWADMRKAED